MVRVVYLLAFLRLSSSSVVTASLNRPNLIFPRDDCTTITVISDDNCDSLATRCGISRADFTTYNPDATLFSTLAIGQRVCCSAGTLPDITPQPNANGTCATHIVKSGESCSSIAADNGLTVDDITGFNKLTTWGFNNCTLGFFAGLAICLSAGAPPLPAPVVGAVCGPTVNGKKSYSQLPIMVSQQGRPCRAPRHRLSDINTLKAR